MSVPPLEASPAYVEEVYQQWKRDPGSVSADWRFFFQGFELGRQEERECVEPEVARAQSRVASLIYAYRSQGHLVARLDPLGNNPQDHPALAFSNFGLTEADLDRTFDTGHLGGPERATLREIIQILKETYCGTIGVEYIHIQNMAIRRWLQSQMEPNRNRPSLSLADKGQILELLSDAEIFETFLHSRYPGQKRFSLEGAESTIPAVHGVVEMAPQMGVERIVLGMTHRGRLNLVANILDKTYEMIFSAFEDSFIPESVGGDGDVKYHRGFSSDHVNRDGKVVHVSLTANPSHLEAVSPVVLGKTRAYQRRLGDTRERKRVIPCLLHGDAAFAGQGVVAEVLNLSQLLGYTVGGTIHLVINNQIGFTTLPHEARSSLYSTDVAKMVEAPIFHVNGDDPEAVVHVMQLALRFRQRFGRDVVVDMICYRKHGHNETDEPAFTQPLLYSKIKGHPSVREIYLRKMEACCDVTALQAKELSQAFSGRLQEVFQRVKEEQRPVTIPAFGGPWREFDNPYRALPMDTGVAREDLLKVAVSLTTIPEGFDLNPKVARYLPDLREAVEEGGSVPWAWAELLAFGSLIQEGVGVRLSGQDSARGTFSQRHAVWQDRHTQRPHIPLDSLVQDNARLCVYNSSLSEAAVLGFDYGYSLAEPRMLVIWEAQFGDFANGAQVIIDQFITSSESKWKRTSGLVMLLPHGYEGQGPEHSNAYLERYLMACAENNIQVCNMTTPAQYFHVLRRQIKRDFRRPLIIMAPKSMLRHPMAVSAVDELIRGRFHHFLDDPEPRADARRLVLCSGKVYYDILAQRGKGEGRDVALVRVEQLYPFHGEELREIASRYPRAEEVAWAQEEPKNRGGWTYMFPLLLDLFPGRRITYIGRHAAASPAVGSLRAFRREQERLVREILS